MQCQEIREMLSPYFDQMLNETEARLVEDHLAECQDCRQELEDLKVIAKLIRESGEYPAPGDFSQQVMEQISFLPPVKAVPRWKRFGTWARLAGVAAVLVLAVGAGMGVLGQDKLLADRASTSQLGAPMAPEAVAGRKAVTNQTSQDMAATNQATLPGEPMAKSAYSSSQTRVPQEQSSSQYSEAANKRKVIKTGHLQVEVTDVDKTYRAIVKLVEGLQGYVENSSFQNSPQGTPADQQNRSGSLTLRVPVKNFAELTRRVGAVGRVVSSQLGGQDVSSQYYDTQARLNSWRQQEAQLGQVLKQAKTIEDILLVREQMQQVRQEIESMEATLKNLGQLSDMGTLTVELVQVKSGQVISLPQQSVWARAREQFVTSINNLLEAGGNLLIWLVGALPVLGVLLLVAGIGYGGYKVWKRYKG